jgi:hypothetical protein
MPKNFKESYLVIGKQKIKLSKLFSQSAFARKYGFSPQNAKNHVKVHSDKFIHVYDKENGINLIAELDSE